MEEPVSKKNILVGFVMIVALLALQAGVAYAAPATQATTITGTVQSVTQSTDASGNVVFEVTVQDSSGNTQTVTVSADTATNVLGLVTLNSDGTYTVNSDAVGKDVTIDGTLIIPVEADPCAMPEGASQPVGAALTRYFCTGLGIDYATIQELQAEGFGYGEIAQACFMAEALGGDATTCSDILMAKQNHDFSTLDFSALGLPEGTMVSNWGQLKKLILSGYAKNTVNLGGVVSGRTDPGALLPGQPMGKSHANGNANGHDKTHDNGNGNGNGHKP
jgi:hypothetical protein